MVKTPLPSPERNDSEADPVARKKKKRMKIKNICIREIILIFKVGLACHCIIAIVKTNREVHFLGINNSLITLISVDNTLFWNIIIISKHVS